MGVSMVNRSVSSGSGSSGSGSMCSAENAETAEAVQIAAGLLTTFGNVSQNQVSFFAQDRGRLLWISCFIYGILLWEVVINVFAELQLYHLPVLRSFFATDLSRTTSTKSLGHSHHPSSGNDALPTTTDTPARLINYRPTEIDFDVPVEEDGTNMAHGRTPNDHQASTESTAGKDLFWRQSSSIPGKGRSLEWRKVFRRSRSNSYTHRANMARFRSLILSLCYVTLRLVTVPYVFISFFLFTRTSHCTAFLRTLMVLHGVGSVAFEVIVLLRTHVAMILFNKRLITCLTPVLCLLILAISALWIVQATLASAVQSPIPVPRYSIGFQCHRMAMNEPTLITAYLLQYAAVIIMCLAAFFSTWKIQGVTTFPVRFKDFISVQGDIRPGEKPISAVRRQFLIDMFRFLAVSTVTHLAAVLVTANFPDRPLKGPMPPKSNPAKRHPVLVMLQFPLQAFFMFAVVPRTVLSMRKAFLGGRLSANTVAIARHHRLSHPSSQQQGLTVSPPAGRPESNPDANVTVYPSEGLHSLPETTAGNNSDLEPSYMRSHSMAHDSRTQITVAACPSSPEHLPGSSIGDGSEDRKAYEHPLPVNMHPY